MNKNVKRKPYRYCLIGCTSLAFCTAGIYAGNQQQTGATVAATVQAKNTKSLKVAPPVVGFETPLIRPNHPPIDEIPPLPMPDPNESGYSLFPGVPLAYDAERGIEWALNTYPPSGNTFGQGKGFNGADGATGSEGSSFASFGDMSQINNTADFPWRMNCKMVLHFVDQNGIDRWFVASGSMQDAETVLTAGHVVYSRAPNGIPIYDWATEIWVYPGWDGVGNQWSAPDSVINPYGYARSTYFLTFTGWSQDGNFDWDMGLVRLTRGVGMMTGWFGWAWGGDCGWIQGQTYHNASFPAENCHNGRDMMYWFGNFDSCPGNQLHLNTDGSCLGTLWGGMSGSAAYYKDGDNRYAHAVASNSNRADSGNYAKMWESFKDAMIDFENDARGSDFDLQALRVRVSPDTVTAGSSLTDRSHLAANPTNGTKNSNFSFGVYLSTNDNISTFDTLLSTQSYSWNFGAMSSVNVNMGTITIPYDTSSGDYWVGVVYDDSTDNNNSNNDSDNWDADPIHVNGVIDVEVDSVNAANGTYSPGDSMNVQMRLENIGGDSSGSFTVDIYASTNTIISTFDTLLGSFNHGNLGKHGVDNASYNVTIPGGLDGNYYIGVIVTVTNDADINNNVDYDPTTVLILQCPGDLDGDGDIDQSDLGILLSAYLINGDGDIDGDGDTDQSDLGILLANYNTTCN